MKEILEKLIQAIENYWKLINYEIETYIHDQEKSIKTEISPNATLLPNTNRPIRGAEGVSVVETSAYNRIALLVGKALKPLEDWELEYKSEEIKSSKALISQLLDELLVEFDNLPNLNERLFEALAFKHFEPDELSRIVKDQEVKYKGIAGALVFQRVLSEAFAESQFKVGLELASECRIQIIGKITHSLTELSERVFNKYEVVIFLNGPLIDSESIISLGEVNIEDFKLELFMDYADDKVLSKLRALNREIKVNAINTICKFNLGIKLDASVETYLFAYELAGRVAEKLVDSLRLVCDCDIGILGLEIIPVDLITPHIRKTFENRYQQELALFLPKRFSYELSTLSPIGELEIEKIKSLITADWHSNTVKGMDIAVKRLRSSIERYMPYDREKLLDLTIALEAIYLNDGDNKELTYRLALRAARLIGTTFDDRKQIFSVVRDLYKYRSKVAHGEDLTSLKKADQERLVKVMNKAPLILKESIVQMLSGNGPIGLKNNEKLAEWWSNLELL